MSVNADDSRILYPPLSILSELFDNASELLGSENNLVAAPGAPAGTYIVAYANDFSNPLTATADIQSGKVSCQSKCERYKSYRICEHCLAVAEKENILPTFVAFFKKADRQKRISDVADIYKAKGAGKKASKATERRKGAINSKRIQKEPTGYAQNVPTTSDVKVGKSAFKFVKQATKSPIENASVDFTKDIVVRIGTPLPPKPPLPEPQTEPYILKK